MQRLINETTTEVDAAKGVRAFTLRSADAADELVLSFHVCRREDVALYDEPRTYKATGNLCFNGQLADELSHLVSTLNRARHTTRL